MAHPVAAHMPAWFPYVTPAIFVIIACLYLALGAWLQHQFDGNQDSPMWARWCYLAAGLFYCAAFVHVMFFA